MTEKSKPAAMQDNPALAIMNAMANVQKSGIGPLAWLGPQMLEKFSAMSSEIAQFVADRIKQDVKMQHEILHCKDLTKLHQIQADFVQTAIDQYTAETGKIVQFNSDLVKQALNKETE